MATAARRQPKALASIPAPSRPISVDRGIALRFARYAVDRNELNDTKDNTLS